MTRFEKLFLGIGAAILIAVIAFRHGGGRHAAPVGYTPDPVSGDLVGDSASVSASGPAYLTFNRPYMAVPPYVQPLPTKTDTPAALYGSVDQCSGGCT